MTTVIFHGVEVSSEWPARITAAQAITTYTLNGRQVKRLPYGRDGAEVVTAVPCPDCAVLAGQLHVPGCELECCPVCGGLLTACGCLDTLESPATMPSLVRGDED